MPFCGSSIVSDDDILERLEETQKWLAEGKVDLGKMKVLMVGNKTDAAGAAERATIVREMYQDQFPFVLRSGDAEGFKKVVYDFLDVVRVYTKAPGKKPDFSDPYVVPRGSTVLDVAEKVHRDFVVNLKYARLWSHGKAGRHHGSARLCHQRRRCSGACIRHEKHHKGCITDFHHYRSNGLRDSGVETAPA